LPDNLQLKVTCFPFASTLASLFFDKDLNKMENLVVNQSDDGVHPERFGKYVAPDGLLGEVNTGSWYQTAYSNMIKNPKKDFLAPIIFLMDKTTISNNAHLSVFAIMFTTTIFTLKVCNVQIMYEKHKIPLQTDILTNV